MAEGLFYYDIPPHQFRDACKYEKTDELFDNDEDWKLLKSSKGKEGVLQDSQLEKKDLSHEEILKLELDSDYKERPAAFEKAFFGNNELFEKFRSLIDKDPEKGKRLSNMESEFLRWLIQNRRGNYEEAKVLVGFYKSSKNFSMYLLWKSIAVAVNLPVGRM